LLKNQEKITNVVKCAERSGAPLEILVIPQWNIKLLEHKQELLNKSKECAFHPEYMRVRLENWIENLQWDWCISRQRFFGVPFPVWYSKREGEEGKILYADFDQLPINPLKHLPRGYQAHEVEADKDVMDTWATSSITPQLNSKAISDSFVIDGNMHKKLFPADLRPQGHEIIRTWAFYTIAKSYFHENSIPWKNLMISGWCLAQDKSKMSKSKGNVVTPNRMLQEHGADVIRYWASTSKLGSDIIYSDEAFKIAKKLINKLYNAGNFLLLHLDTNKLFNTTASDDISKQIIYAEIDLWFITKINQLITKVNEELNKFEYFSARSAVEKFFWSDFCDYYMEITKVRVYNQRRVSDKEKDSAVHTLYHSLNAILKLFAPYIPYITEHLYQRINKNESIHAKNTWPRLSDFPVSSFDKQAELLINIVDAVRKFKTEQQLSLNASIETVTLYGADLPNSMIQDLKDVCNITDVISEASLSSQGETENVILVGDECYLKIIGQ
jgi:valyl-tRNA synthetase